MSRYVRIGTRGSALALWQANTAANLLAAAGYEPDIVTVKTTGDQRTDVPLAAIGGKGLFIKELEEALESGKVDVAVHSLKDVPSIIPEHFELAAFLERADPRDAWVHPENKRLADVPAGSVIGTSSPRRRAQILEKHPQLRVEDIRGNVDTRLSKARDGQYAGVILAGAGMIRLGRASEITSFFGIDEMVPAAGQGIVAIECLRENAYASEAAGTINHTASAMAARCERGVLHKFGERLDCYSAIAVHATVDGASVDIRAFASDLEGTRPVRARRTGRNCDAVVSAVYDDLVAQGAAELLCRK
jgi:hydroxymethylbilane synthase